jgi:enoyl-[acyl-carrier protein] reductase III
MHDMSKARHALYGILSARAIGGPRGITVNGISPGGVFGASNAVGGSILRTLPSEIQVAIQTWHESGWTPMRRLGTPEDIGNAVRLPCMDEASFITEQILHVDGGALIMDSVFPLNIQQG